MKFLHLEFGQVGGGSSSHRFIFGNIPLLPALLCRLLFTGHLILNVKDLEPLLLNLHFPFTQLVGYNGCDVLL
ncbi:MAG: hypothetical protein DDT26_01624 [Dehalococcoidia bacterium]|nr:hypothetical protein [Chloroflexota bacterium]